MFAAIACIVLGAKFGSTAAIVLGIIQICVNVIKFLVESKD